MSNLFVNQEAVFIGANKQSQVLDYNLSENIVAYGASNTIALWNPLNNNGTYYTLKNHTKEVTCVKFIPSSPFLVSSSEDCKINVWKKDGDKFVLHQSLEEHKSSVTTLAVINNTLFVSGGADGIIALWSYDNNTGSFKLSHEFEVAFNFYPISLALQNVDDKGTYVLAVSGTSTKLFIYSFTLTSDIINNFSQSAVLTGHEDWIRCLLFGIEEEGKNYVLASGSQDRYIRLWRLKLNDAIDNSDEDALKLILLSNKQYKFNIGESVRASFNFEALIMGHDDWVTGLQWCPKYHHSNKDEKLQLLSSSADTALMVWEMDTESGIWCCVNRLGELSIKGASTATGASGGFWSCLWFIKDNTQYILANGKTGSIRIYKSKSNDEKTFEPHFGVTGPNREITDIKWSLDGSYFSATSLDQTTRIFAPWKHENSTTWHEFARPQIHGYDMICLDNIDSSKFVSGGDEKVIRVFEMTNSINKLLNRACGIESLSAEEQEALPESASLPVLGLSNKAANEQLEAGEAAQQQQDAQEELSTENKHEDVLDTLNNPPLEDHLQRYTLFPEIEKLYGHGYEIVSCAVSPNGKLIASSCRSNSVKHAVIRIFNIQKDYQQCQQILEGHNLTITNLEFSPDGKYLLAVSRDRQFSLWKVENEEEGEFSLFELNPKAHSRIIWDSTWVPQNSFGNYFITGSRDKQIKLWEVLEKVELRASIKLSDAVTAVSAFKSFLQEGKLLVAVGLENGSISIYSLDLKNTNKEFKLEHNFDSSITPSGRISRLDFSSKLHDNEQKLLLSVGSEDTSVRLYSIDKNMFI